MSSIAVFLDRDGTVSEEVGFITELNQLVLLPRAAEAIRLLNRNKIIVILATNQSGIARGYFTESFLERLHYKLNRLLNQQQAYIDAIYYCPHHPEFGSAEYRKLCDCRKPRTGMLERAAHEFNLCLSGSYLVGDSQRDIECAQRVGAKSSLVLTGYGQAVWQEIQKQSNIIKPDYVAVDLYDAVQWILKDIALQKK